MDSYVIAYPCSICSNAYRHAQGLTVHIVTEHSYRYIADTASLLTAMLHTRSDVAPTRVLIDTVREYTGYEMLISPDTVPHAQVEACGLRVCMHCLREKKQIIPCLYKRGMRDHKHRDNTEDFQVPDAACWTKSPAGNSWKWKGHKLQRPQQGSKGEEGSQGTASQGPSRSSYPSMSAMSGT